MLTEGLNPDVVDGRDVDWIKTLLTEGLGTGVVARKGVVAGRVDLGVDWKG